MTTPLLVTQGEMKPRNLLLRNTGGLTSECTFGNMYKGVGHVNKTKTSRTLDEY
jgi:hypothetical protein